MSAARVLVVDDNRDMANGIALLLREAQIDAQVAHSGKGALAALEKLEFELVLSDIRMPGMSGLDLLATIRSHWPLTKVVLLTAYGTIDSAVGAMRDGACDYLTKPFDNNELLRVVQRAIQQGASCGGLDVGAIVGETTAALSTGELLAGLRSALGVLVRATGADDGEIFLCEPEGKDPLLCVWVGPDGDALAERTRFRFGHGFPGIVVATGKPLCVKGGLPDDARYLRRAVVDAGVRSQVAAPLSDSRGILGSIHLMSRRDDFPVERVLDLLERTAAPICAAIRAELAALRQSVDTVCDSLDDSGRSLRVVLESMRQAAGAQYGTLALIDPATGRPNRVVSTGAASLVCRCAEAGEWSVCPSLTAAHGFVADPGRRSWPVSCRQGLPRRVTSPCCLPIAANGRLYGLVVLDFGREGTDHAIGHLVPLLSMTHQLAIRLRSLHAGFVPDTRGNVGEISAPPSSSPELELRCLGPFAVFKRGEPISADNFKRSKALVLLKLLAIKVGTPVNRDVLVEQLWPEVDPQQGVNRLHVVLHDLRSVIEPRGADREWVYVRNRGELYYLDTRASMEVDVHRFRHLSAQGLRASSVQEAITHLEQAIELYRGDLFEDEPFADWCAAEREDLRQTYVQALERLAELCVQQGSEDAALSYVRRALQASSFRDDLFLAQMKLLERLGRASEAVASYSEYRRRMAADLEAEPSAELQAFHTQLRKTARKSS